MTDDIATYADAIALGLLGIIFLWLTGLTLMLARHKKRPRYKNGKFRPIKR